MNSAEFREKALMVFKAKGFSEEDVEEAKAQIRECWSDETLKACWINWIREEAKIWR
jgi:hypothetical protein